MTRRNAASAGESSPLLPTAINIDDAIDEIERVVADDFPRQPVGDGDVQNKHEFLAEVDRFFGHDKPPAVEFLLSGDGHMAGFGFGHAALRYTLFSRAGKPPVSRLVNITMGTGGVGEEHLVSVWEDTSDYVFGTIGNIDPATGRGDNYKKVQSVHKMPICSIRIPEWDDESVAALHHYLRAVRAATKTPRKHVSFSFFQTLLDPWRLRFGLRQTLHGNCSNWTSRALFLAGLEEREHNFPKAQWVDLFENHVLDGTSPHSCKPRAEVVYYHHIGVPLGWCAGCTTIPSPIYCLRSLVYSDLLPFADAVVTCAEDASGKLVASIEKGQARRPGYMLVSPIRHFHSLVVAAIVVVYLLYGWPAPQDCEVGVYGTRIFLMYLLIVINGALY